MTMEHHPFTHGLTRKTCYAAMPFFFTPRNLPSVPSLRPQSISGGISGIKPVASQVQHEETMVSVD